MILRHSVTLLGNVVTLLKLCANGELNKSLYQTNCHKKIKGIGFDPNAFYF